MTTDADTGTWESYPHPPQGNVFCQYAHKCMRLNTIWCANCKNNDAHGDFYSPQEWWYQYPRVTWFSIGNEITDVNMDSSTTTTVTQGYCDLAAFYEELGQALARKGVNVQKGEDNFKPHK